MATKKPYADKIAELEKTYPRNVHTVLDGKLFFFRPPTLDEFEEYQSAVGSGSKPRGVCFRELAQLTLVFPETVEELQAAFERYPIFSARISDAIAEVAGSEIELTVKKD